ncbi:LysR family transcriptional regulator [Oleiagrimonas sp. MCCC 1A03011]|uniref:LysR family transcriptional regulator n=1 Tax=Oleiagrimonas sp. MCCC 1A03011 TaxID=1926883 RepID=UPI000DC59FBD|nr:LysR family transcriptional regulator [Oleiagrimonas sp. MCCC 1A03011]RAP59175.1 transcriptional regulator [Oleiagrimonas sp. MCCC 1A03011]
MISQAKLPPLNTIRAFEAIAKHGSVSQAALALHVTHGAVSRQLRLLEEDLGCALFERRGRGLVITDAGRHLRDVSTEALELLRGARQRLRREIQATALVLSCPGSILARWMIPRLEQLRREQPDLELHLSASEKPPGPTLDGLDATLLIAEPPWPDAWTVHSLATEHIGPVMAPVIAEALSAQDASPRALLRQPLLHTASRPQAWPTWARAQGMQTDTLRMGQGFEHLYYLLEAAVAGLGVAIAPQQLVADDLSAGRLVAPWGFTPTSAEWVLCSRAGHPDERIPRLAGWLHAQLTETH